nr:MAG TPA: hypothetical protein [Caudoviricetes sp.]
MLILIDNIIERYTFYMYNLEQFYRALADFTPL